jgi:hypothetical protein
LAPFRANRLFLPAGAIDPISNLPYVHRPLGHTPLRHNRSPLAPEAGCACLRCHRRVALQSIPNRPHSKTDRLGHYMQLRTMRRAARRSSPRPPGQGSAKAVILRIAATTGSLRQERSFTPATGCWPTGDSFDEVSHLPQPDRHLATLADTDALGPTGIVPTSVNPPSSLASNTASQRLVEHIEFLEEHSERVGWNTHTSFSQA